MKTSIFFIVLLFFADCYCQFQSSGDRGYSYIENYSFPDIDQHPQNWSIAQSENGLLYFGNTGGLIEFDGIEWNRIRIPNNIARTVNIINGNIYLGGRGEFGYLSADSTFSYKYNSLIKLIKPPRSSFSIIYNSHVINNVVYLVAPEALYIIEQNEVISLPAEESFAGSYVIDSTVYVIDKNVGVKKLINYNLQSAAEFNDLLPYVVTSMLKVNPKTILICTYKNGMFYYDKTGLNKFETEIDRYLKENLIYYATILSDNKISIATRLGGLVIIDIRGNLIKYFNEENGLQDNTVRYVYEDRQNNLWLALNNGVTKIEYSSPFSFFDKRSNLSGIVLSIAKVNNKLYVGTTNGLFFKDLFQENGFSVSASFNQIGSIKGGVWSLLKFGNELIIGAEDGIFILNNTINKIDNGKIYYLYADKLTNVVYVGTDSGLKLLHKNNKDLWTVHKVEAAGNDNIHTVFRSKENIWLGTLSKGVIRIKENPVNIINPLKVDRYDERSGLPPGEINIYGIADRPVFATQKGLYKFDEVKNYFLPDSILGNEFADGSRGVFRLSEDSNGNIWFHSNNENYKAVKLSGNEYKVISNGLKRLKHEQVNVIYPNDSLVWFGTKDRVISFNSHNKKKYNYNFNALIRKVFVNTDSLIYGGAPLPNKSQPIKLEYENRNIRFQYASTFYEAEKRIVYQYKLEGYDDNWSRWTSETKKDYTNLSEGNYRFSIRAKNVYGNLSSIDNYSFKILSPIYRTIWAYIIYVLLFVGLGYVTFKWRINKIEKEKKKLEDLVDVKTKEVKEQAEKLKELDKIKSRFFANISHEFRTPLTLIIGPAEQLIAEEEAEEKKSKFSLIIRHSKRLLRLINQLMDLSKLESGKLKLNLKRINIVRFVREITSMFESLADEKNILIDFSSEVDSINILCDPDKMEKVFVNLISNAFKFTQENGSIFIKIDITEDDPENKIRISVKDTGIGIPQEQLEHIFDIFFQADSSTKREYEGTGIGLSIVKEFIELHGGEIIVESKLNQGSEFVITLPIQQGTINEENIESVIDLDENKFESIRNELSEAGYRNVSDMDDSNEINTLLIVEDNIDVRVYLKDYFKNNYNIIEASNGFEGLEKANSFMPDLIVSDVMMPEMDGYEFCEKIKSEIHTSHIPVILLTAKAGSDSIMEGLETGADDYITKPFNINILASRIKNLIELRLNLQKKFQKNLLLQPSEIKVSSLDDIFLNKLHDLIEENLSNPELNIESLSEKFAMSRVSLFRKIKALTGQSPVKFLRSYRLKRAAQLLKAKSGNVTEIAFEVGFTNSAYFTKCFKEQFDRLPSEFD